MNIRPCTLGAFTVLGADGKPTGVTLLPGDFVGAVAFVFGAKAHLTVRAAAAAPSTVEDEFGDELAAPAGGSVRTSTRPALNKQLFDSPGMSFPSQFKSCGLVLSRFEWLLSLTLLAAGAGGARVRRAVGRHWGASDFAGAAPSVRPDEPLRAPRPRRCAPRADADPGNVRIHSQRRHQCSRISQPE